MAKNITSLRARLNSRFSLLVLVLISAVGVSLWQPVSLDQLFDWGSRLSAQPWIIPVVILVQALLFTFALPGTLMMWAVAPFFSLPISVIILLSGSLIGALGAYRVAYHLGDTWEPRRGAWLIRLLKQRSDFYTQCALRTLPGCPHWAINYTSGVIKAPLAPYLLAAVVGLSVKWTLYCWVVQGATTAAQAGEQVGMDTLWPLLVLAAALLTGSMVRHRMILKIQKQDQEPPP